MLFIRLALQRTPDQWDIIQTWMRNNRDFAVERKIVKLQWTVRHAAARCLSERGDDAGPRFRGSS